MLNQVYWARTKHQRFKPVPHKFEYPVISVAVDIKTIKNSAELSYNRFGIWSIFDTDYLFWGKESLFEKYQRACKLLDIDSHPESVMLVTSPRYFNYVFNPVNFYYAYKHGELSSVLVEVTNTYKEKQLYLVNADNKSDKKLVIDTQSKAFHVSPFFNEEGEYQFTIHPLETRLDIGIRYTIEDETVFFANLVGTPRPLSWKTKWISTLRFPLTIALTMPRILWQAFLLYYRRKLPAKSKPIPHHIHTIRKWRPTMFQKICRYAVHKLFNKATSGGLEIEEPNLKRLGFGEENQSKKPLIKVNDYKFYSRVALKGSIGFGEAYTNGEWSSDSVPDVLRFFIQNEELISGGNDSGLALFYKQKLNRHRGKRNTKTQSKQNIQDHYDLSNTFYQQFLDPSMMYSSALYKNKTESLEEAQELKVNRLIETLDIQEGQSVLEIGSGWGTVAIEMAKRYNVSVKTLTLSNEQYNYVQNRLKTETLKGKVEVVLQDYRDEKGTYDRIISVEMIEAVGEEYLASYFQTISHSLRPKGKLMLQAITIRDDRYEEYCRNTDWIQQYIFPGGHLPSLERIRELTKSVNLSEKDLFDLTLSYAKTLEDWRLRFLEKWEMIQTLGFDDEFKRKWLYYLMYCQAGFETNMIQNYQLLFQKDTT